MLRRLIRVILARKRNPQGLRAEARRWERLYWREYQRSADLLDKVLITNGAGSIQEKPAPASGEKREPRLEDLTDDEFQAQMEAAEVEEWATRARYDATAKVYLEGLALYNSTAKKALDKLNSPTQ